MEMAMQAAISGVQAGESRLDVTANNIANVNTDGFHASVVTTKARNPYGTETVISEPSVQGNTYVDEQGNIKEMSNVDVATQVVNLLIAEATVKANAEALRTADSLTGTILDLLV